MRTAWMLALALALVLSGCVSIGPLATSARDCDHESLPDPMPADTPGVAVEKKGDRWVATRTVETEVPATSLDDRIAIDIGTVNGAVDLGRGVDKARVKIEMSAKGDTESEALARLATITPDIRIHRTSLRAHVETDQWCDRAAAIDVDVPADRVLNGDVGTTNGGVKVEGVSIENGEIRTINGQITVVNTELRAVAVSTVNGALDFDRVRGSGLDAETVNGQIHLRSIDIEGIEARTTNGAIDGHVTVSRVLLIGTTNGAVDLMVHPKASLLMTIDAANGPVDLALEEGGTIAYDLGLRTSNGAIRNSMDEAEYTGDAKRGTLSTPDGEGRAIQVDGSIETANAGIHVDSAAPR